MLQDYTLPTTVDEALILLTSCNGTAKVIAGGTDLALDLESGEVSANCLVDVSNIQELKKIETNGGAIIIGGGVTHSEVAGSDLIKEKAAVLANACRAVGSLQIRNTGTLAGNVVNAQPAADAAVALVALGAQAVIAGPEGLKSAPVEELYAGVGKSKVDSTREIVTQLHFPALTGNQGSAFARLAQRKALALPMLNVAAVVSIIDNTFEWARIVMAPVGPGPVRAKKAEELLAGTEVNSTNLQKAAAASCAEANPRSSSLRGSREYRIHVLEVLVRRALEMAVANAQKS